MEVNFIVLLQIESLENARSVEELLVYWNELLVGPLLLEQLLPVLLLVKFVVEGVKVAFEANRSIACSPLRDTNVPQRLPDDLLLLVVLLVVGGYLLLVTSEQLLVDLLLSVLLPLEKLVLELLDFLLFLFLLDLGLGFGPECEAAEVFAHLLLQSEGWVREVRYLLDALGEFFDVNLVTTREAEEVDGQVGIRRIEADYLLLLLPSSS